MRVSTVPYRTPSPERIIGEPWLILGERPQELSASLEGWDYATDLRISRRLRVDTEKVLLDVGLPPGASLIAHVRCWPSTSRIRKSVARSEIRAEGSRPTEVTADIAGADLSGSLTIETLVELASDISDGRRFSPARAGSILWRDQVQIVLEGESGLLPIAPVSFTEAGLPSAAAWYLSLDSARWDWTAMGSILVLLNTDNAAVMAALGDESTAEAALLLDTVGVDFVADLVGRAIEDESFWESHTGEAAADSGDEPSVGALVRALTRTRLAEANETTDESLVRLKELRERDPSMYRAVVQHGLRFPRSAV